MTTGTRRSHHHRRHPLHRRNHRKRNCLGEYSPPELAARGPAKTTGRFAPQENVMDYFCSSVILFMIIDNRHSTNIHLQVTRVEESTRSNG